MKRPLFGLPMVALLISACVDRAATSMAQPATAPVATLAPITLLPPPAIPQSGDVVIEQPAVSSSIFNIILLVLGLSAIYSLVILMLVLLLRKIGVPGGRAIILGFLIFGAVTGVLMAWAWPLDSSIYFNPFATYLGDQVYNLSIQYLGEMHSAQAHYTIPWLLRIPQVYVLTSMVLCGLVSLAFQWVYNRVATGGKDSAR